MSETTIHRTKVESLLRAIPRGVFFSVTFIKKDNSIRKILCQFPKPKPNPKRPSPAHLDNAYILVRDMVIYKQVLEASKSPNLAADRSYRLINLATIQNFKVGHTLYSVVDL